MEQIHKIFKLCGSPCDEYWNKLELPQTGIFKPSRQYRRCLVETFKGFPPSALVLLDNLLSLEPEARGTAASTLQSDVSILAKQILKALFIVIVVLISLMKVATSYSPANFVAHTNRISS